MLLPAYIRVRLACRYLPKKGGLLSVHIFKKVITLALILGMAALAFGCGGQTADLTEKTAEPVEVILSTTTSTMDSGLLDVLIPLFEEKYPEYYMTPVSVGTGAALEMGKRGEADVMLVHAPDSEIPLVESGDAINRQLVMHNDFIIIGPAADPAGIKGLTDAKAALTKIYDSEAGFVSRGDDSGTHKKELAVWAAAGLEPQGSSWYVETGKGMGDTLAVANEEMLYTLTDRATYLALKDNLDLEILAEGDEILKNIYHVMQVNPEKGPQINAEGAAAFVEFMIAPETQEVIANFGVDQYGMPLFFPDAGKGE